jgi:hypothetical protein
VCRYTATKFDAALFAVRKGQYAMICSSTTRRTAVWIAPGSKPFDLIRIYSLSAIPAFFFLYFGNIWIEPGASEFIKVAQAMLGDAHLDGGLLNGGQGREIGMALIWLISGYELSHSLTGVIIIQVLMGLAIPLLCYLTLHPWLPRTAYYTAIVAGLSLAPFLLSKTLHHDQPYIFFTILSLYAFNRYMLTKSAGALCGMTASIFAAGLMLDAGTGLFWLLMPICAWGAGRQNFKYVILAILMFVGANIAYGRYRETLQGSAATQIVDVSAPGIQLFYNVYVNASEFGVTLSPALGPDVTWLLNGLHECLFPSPSQSKPLANMPGSPQLKAANIDRYTTDELINKITTQPNRYYYIIIRRCFLADQVSVLDSKMLGAAVEITLGHPLYILKLFLKNSIQLLYNPGWLHDRFTIGPRFQGGLHFPFGDNATLVEGGNVGDRKLDKHAVSEAEFIPLERQPHFVANLYYAVYRVWYSAYHPMTMIVGCLAWLAWISTAIGLLQRTIGGQRLEYWGRLFLSDAVIPASIGISMTLIGNVAVTAIAVDPIYRYDFSILVLKIMVAGVGCAVMVELFRRMILVILRRGPLYTM